MAELLHELELPPVSPAPAPAPVASFALAVAERAVAENRHADAIAALREDGSLAAQPELALRAALLESWSLLALGEVDDALREAQRAYELSAGPRFDDVDRADALYHLGCCRFKRAEIALAVSLFTVALDLCTRAARPCGRLRAGILEWRSRCYQHQRDWDAARLDVERALELAAALGDDHAAAHVYFQASNVAERTGDRRMACFYAEQAEAIYREVGDLRMLGRILNNLGCLLVLQGDETRALLHLEEAIRVAIEVGGDADVAQAASSVAQVHLRGGRPELAEEQARNALDVLAGRVDYLDEIGSAQLVLGRVLAEQQRLDEADAALRDAERTFVRLGSKSHVAAALVARGDLLRSRGDCDGGADLYRLAADTLQDLEL